MLRRLHFLAEGSPSSNISPYLRSSPRFGMIGHEKPSARRDASLKTVQQQHCDPPSVMLQARPRLLHERSFCGFP